MAERDREVYFLEESKALSKHEKEALRAAVAELAGRFSLETVRIDARKAAPLKKSQERKTSKYDKAGKRLAEQTERTWPKSPEDYMGKEHFWQLAVDLGSSRKAGGTLFSSLCYPLDRQTKTPIQPSAMGMAVSRRSEVGLDEVSYYSNINKPSPNYFAHLHAADESTQIPEVQDVVIQAGSVIEIIDKPQVVNLHMGDKQFNLLMRMSFVLKRQTNYPGTPQ